MGTTMFKLQNICLGEMSQLVQEPTLFCRGDAPVIFESDGTILLTEAGRYDFTTFFGALSTCKWKLYTVAKEFCIHIELYGAEGEFHLTEADTFSYSPTILEEESHRFDASDGWISIDSSFPTRKNEVINSFILDIKGPVRIRNAYYAAPVDDEAVRTVELALATTTFKKESFITANIALVKEHILNSNEPIAHHFHMHVVDNGRTLNAEKLECEGVSIHPNNNVGGAGGFARGMIAAMEQNPKATHVLLMDDDVEISPESIIRTFNLLSIVNDDYAEAFVSGAMMNMEEPELRWEDVGFMAFDGTCRPVKPVLNVNKLQNVVQNELFRPASDIEAYSDTKQTYAAWWYCCIPMAVIEREGLPLPVFVRFDDIEYGLRCHPKIMSMNGICIWHAAFHMRYNAGVERYQTTRNAFIAQSITGIAPRSDFLKEFHHNVHLELKKFNYTDAELALEGFEDFLKGPSYIMQPIAEERFMYANKKKEQLKPFNELYDEALSLGIDLKKITLEYVTLDVPRRMLERSLDFITFNGQRLNLGYSDSGKTAVIDARGWMYPGGKIRRAEHIIAVDIFSRKAAIRHKDSTRFRELWNRYKRDVKYYKANKERLTKEYAAVRDEITSVAFWKNYLGISQ